MKKNKKNINIVKKNNGVNEHLLNIITPSGFDYDKNFASLGENTGKIFTISKYPLEADYGWLAPLCNLEGTSTTIEYRYTEPDRQIKVFNAKIKELRSNKETVKDESERQKLDQSIKDLEEMINRISLKNEPVGYVNTMLHIQDVTLKNLNDRIKRVSSVVSVSGCNLKNIRYKQLQALKCISPYGIPEKIVAQMGERNMPISTFIGGFPMANAGINDPEGYYIGKTENNKLVILNQWRRDKDRINSNWVVFGMPGTGKSTLLKKIFTYELALGTKFIVFDPEEEYIDLANHPNIQGDIIDCAGGTTGRINPLQIRVSPRITKEDLEEGEKIEDFYNYDESNGISDMALYIQNLRVFFKLYFGSLEDDIKVNLEKCLIKLYNNFKIYWDTDISKLRNEDFPIMTDLYNVVEEETKSPDLSEYKRSSLEKLLDKLYSVAHGADQYIWNGHTTLNPKSKFIVLNTSKLLDADENVKKAQFYNLTLWGWQQMSADRTEKTILAEDEGYLFIDPDLIDLMKFNRNISKRARKYEGGLMFITHSCVDLLHEEVRRLGQAIIDNACYKLILGCDGKQLEETKKLFNLTEKEEAILASKNRGQGIFFAGSVRLNLKIDVRPKILDMFGKAGGR